MSAFLDRMPAPLFGGLAALALVGEDGGIADPVTVAAVAGAALAARTRSLPPVLAAGLLAGGVTLWLI